MTRFAELIARYPLRYYRFMRVARNALRSWKFRGGLPPSPMFPRISYASGHSIYSIAQAIGNDKAEQAQKRPRP